MTNTPLGKLYVLKRAQGTLYAVWGKDYAKLLSSTLAYYKAHGKLRKIDEAHIELMYDKYQEILKQAKETKKNDTI